MAAPAVGSRTSRGGSRAAPPARSRTSRTGSRTHLRAKPGERVAQEPRSRGLRGDPTPRDTLDQSGRHGAEEDDFVVTAADGQRGPVHHVVPRPAIQASRSSRSLRITSSWPDKAAVRVAQQRASSAADPSPGRAHQSARSAATPASARPRASGPSGRPPSRRAPSRGPPSSAPSGHATARSNPSRTSGHPCRVTSRRNRRASRSTPSRGSTFELETLRFTVASDYPSSAARLTWLRAATPSRATIASTASRACSMRTP